MDSSSHVKRLKEKQKQHKAFLQAIRKQNGSKTALGLQHMDLTPMIVSILEFAGDIEVDEYMRMVLEDMMFSDKRTLTGDEQIQKAFEGGKNLNEQEKNKTLRQMFERACQSGDYQEVMEGVFDKKGYFVFIVNPPGHDFSDKELQRRQDITRGYYQKGAELCTFGTDRFKNWFIIQVIDKRLIQNLDAVKKALAERDYDSLEQELMKNKDAIEIPENPHQHDEYSLSTPVIQISKEEGFVKMLCRYNHRIGPSCDRTLGSNPNNLHPGLSVILNRRLGLPDHINLTYRIPGNFVVTQNMKIVKYYNEIDGMYFGEKCFVNEGLLFPLDENEVSADFLRINKKDRSVMTWPKFIHSGIGHLAQLLNDEICVKDKNGKLKIDKHGVPKRRAIEFSYDEKTKEKTVMMQNDDGKWERLLSFKDGRITTLCLPTAKVLPPRCVNLLYLRDFSAPEVTHVQEYNFFGTRALERVFLPKVQKLENACFMNCSTGRKLTCYLPKMGETLLPSWQKNICIVTDNWQENPCFLEQPRVVAKQTNDSFQKENQE